MIADEGENIENFGKKNRWLLEYACLKVSSGSWGGGGGGGRMDLNEFVSRVKIRGSHDP